MRCVLTSFPVVVDLESILYPPASHFHEQSLTILPFGRSHNTNNAGNPLTPYTPSHATYPTALLSVPQYPSTACSSRTSSPSTWRCQQKFRSVFFFRLGICFGRATWLALSNICCDYDRKHTHTHTCTHTHTHLDNWATHFLIKCYRAVKSNWFMNDLPVPKILLHTHTHTHI